MIASVYDVQNTGPEGAHVAEQTCSVSQPALQEAHHEREEHMQQIVAPVAVKKRLVLTVGRTQPAKADGAGCNSGRTVSVLKP